MKKSKRKDTASKTLKELEQGFYFNTHGEKINLASLQKYTEQHTQLFTPEKLEEICAFALNEEGPYTTSYEVVPETTLEGIFRLSKNNGQGLMALNFASAKNPGGGFLGGAQAQEESLARGSGLYPSLLKAKPYYDFHRNQKSCLYSDHMIYSPLVAFYKDDDGEVLDHPILSSVITSPAVNTGVVKRNDKKNVDKIIPFMQRRIRKMLALAYLQKQDTLILGAWGCGVFQNEPLEIAQLFKEALDEDFKGKFKHISFSIYARDERFIKPFYTVFGV